MADPVQDSKPRPDRGRNQRRGEVSWRGVRYLAVLFAGYLLGMVASSFSEVESPSWWILVLLGALALWLVFRQGKKSVSHAAADAVAAANARANAAAVAANQNHITVAGGHVVQSGGETTSVDAWSVPVAPGDEFSALEAPVDVEVIEAPPLLDPETLSSPQWSYVGESNGEPVFSYSGEFRRFDQLPSGVRHEIVSASFSRGRS